MSARRLAWGLFSACLALGALYAFFEVVGGRGQRLLGEAPFVVLSAVVFPFVGALISSRRPDHPIGWIYLAFGVVQTGASFSFAYASYGLLENPGSLPAANLMAWLASWAWAPGTALLATFSFLLFPDGRLPSHRWRTVAWLAAGGISLIFVAGLLLLPEMGPHLLEGEDPDGPAIVAFLAAAILLGAGVAGSVASLFVRLRRASGEQRQQLKWFFFAGTLFAAGLVAEFGPGPDLRYFTDACLYSVPLATGIAILKHRLYDIDVIINRALVYAALTASLALMYLGSVVLLQGAFRALIGQDSQFAVVASTLAIAALFNPLRRRIQGFVDRRFYRDKYDARKTLEAFSAKLRDETNLDDLGDDLVGVVRDTVRPAHVSLWLREPDAGSRSTVEQRKAAL